MAMCTDNAAMIAAAGIYRLAVGGASPLEPLGQSQLAVGGRARERWTPLNVEDCDDNPFVQFRDWFDEAQEPDGRSPSHLPRHIHARRPSERANGAAAPRRRPFLWLVHQLRSRKGRGARGQSLRRAALVQRAPGSPDPCRGSVAQMSASESDAYFAFPGPRSPNWRPREPPEPAPGQSKASSKIAFERSRGRSSPGVRCPVRHYWGGYRLTPSFSSSGSTARTVCTTGWPTLPVDGPGAASALP